MEQILNLSLDQKKEILKVKYKKSDELIILYSLEYVGKIDLQITGYLKDLILSDKSSKEIIKEYTQYLEENITYSITKGVVVRKDVFGLKNINGR